LVSQKPLSDSVSIVEHLTTRLRKDIDIVYTSEYFPQQQHMKGKALFQQQQQNMCEDPLEPPIKRIVISPILKSNDDDDEKKSVGVVEKKQELVKTRKRYELTLSNLGDARKVGFFV
jgi:hypothetical protein